MKRLDSEQKSRLKKVLTTTAILLGVGVGYLLIIQFTPFGIPCVFHLVTGLDCPGCGISRMFVALSHGDILLAAQSNLLVLCLLPFGLVLAGYKTWQYVRTGEMPMGKLEKAFYLVAFVLCVIFFIVRNI